MTSLHVRAIAIVVALASSAAACAGKSSGAAETLTKPTAVLPFESLPIPAYEGTGVAEVGTLTLRGARDVAYAQAYRLLSQNIMTLHVNRVTEIVGPGQEVWVSPVGSSVSRAMLVGKKFTDEVQVGNRVWVRVYMAKSEVDAAVTPSLQRMVEELAPAMREAFARELRGITPAEEELRILAEFQRRHGREQR